MASVALDSHGFVGNSNDQKCLVFRIFFPICFFQAASPACTELETIVLDWLGKAYFINTLSWLELHIIVYHCAGKAIGLPDDFLALKKGSKGGGVIQVWPIQFSSLHSACTSILFIEL